MRLIELSKQGKNKNQFTALVDDMDFEWMNQFRWRVWTGKHGHRYAQTGTNGNEILMHRLILGLRKGEMCDHINGDGLDNRRNNLRKATYHQNQCNQKIQIRKKSSQFKGVSWDVNKKKWHAQLQYKGKNMHFGNYSLESEAAKAYDSAAVKYFGEFSNTNSMMGLV